MSKEIKTIENVININQTRLPSPSNIAIMYTRVTGQCIVTWDKIVGTEYDVYYNIYRGISYNGIFYKQNIQPVFQNKYVDNTLNKNPNVCYWYKISSLYKIDDQWIEGVPSRPVQYKIDNLNKWFNKMNERNFWILKNTGINCTYYQRKYEGERCTCYDPLRGMAGSSTCNLCWGTGIKGGYSPPIELYLRFNNVAEALQQDIDSWSFMQNGLTAWTISPIRLRNRDVIMDNRGVLYSVIASTINTAAGYYWHQDMQLKSLESNDPLYNMVRTKIVPTY